MHCQDKDSCTGNTSHPNVSGCYSESTSGTHEVEMGFEILDLDYPSADEKDTKEYATLEEQFIQMVDHNLASL